MASYSDNRPNEEEEEEDIDDADYKIVKDAILFAIDVSPSMTERPPYSDDKKAERDSPTLAALKCAYQLMQQRIISNPTDMMGILLFGTEKTEVKDGDGVFEHCYLLSELDVPTAQDVKRLRDLVENEDEAAALLKPSSEGASIATVLFCANQLFTTKAPNFSSRRLFLVTDNDYPVQVKKDKDSAIVRARDLYDLGCTIDLFPISRTDHSFDRSRFYDDLVYPTSSSDPDAPASIVAATKVARSGDGISLLNQLLSSINSKATARRALFSLPLELGPGIRIGVKGFTMIKRQEHIRSCYVWVGGEKVQIVSGSTSHLADDTARVVEKREIRKAYKFGGDTITFSPEEFVQIRRCFGDPVIRVIGFKPLSAAPIWANTGKATFIYPSEAEFIGSTRVFSALQQKLLKSKKIAVAWFIARKSSSPVIVAIIPGQEKLNEEDEQVMPPGLWLVPLPFADDIRQPVVAEDPLKTTDVLTDKMRVIIEQLQFPKSVYDPAKYPNPGLQYFYRILQAMALEEEVPTKAEDKTIPKYKQIDKRAGEYVAEFGAEFKDVLSSQSRRPSTALPSRKRAAGRAVKEEESEPKPARKKVKKEVKDEDNGLDGANDGGMTNEEMAALNDRGNVGKQSVAVLKDFLKARKLPPTGKKLDLVERVQTYLEKKGF